jgi:hypothetical protein
MDGQGILASFNMPQGIAIDAAGNLYVTEKAGHKIRKITPSGLVSTLAGDGIMGWIDGPPGGLARFAYPVSIAVDASGNAYVGDAGNNVIRKITPAGDVSTFAGSGNRDFIDGSTSASFNNIEGIAVDISGNVFVADYNNVAIRKISPAGIVSTFAGNTILGSMPLSVTIDALGNVYVGEYYGVVRKIDASDTASILAGTEVRGSADGIGEAAGFSAINGLCLDGTGSLYVADSENNKIRRIILTGYTIIPSLPAGLNFDSATGIISGTPTTGSPTTVYDITAINNSGRSVRPLTLTTVNPLAPIVSSYSPAFGSIGTTVTITGTNLGGATAVSFGGTAATSFTVNSPTSITGTVGSGTSGSVSVTTVEGTATLAGFSFIPAPPAITSFTPSSAAIGAQVTITGTNLSGATAVIFGNTDAASFSVNSATSITATVRPGTSGSVSVTTAGGTANLAGFSFIPAPTITSFTPSSAATGAQVTITGTNLDGATDVSFFTGATAVGFGGTAASSFTVISPTSITATVGAGTSGNVSVTTAGGTANLAGFSFIPAPPIITSFTPSSAASASQVTITGTNLGERLL